MLNFIGRLINIRPNEWSRLLFLYAMYFMFIVGVVWAELTLEAAFLQRIGVDALSWFLVFKALAAIIVSSIYAAFADRINNTKLLIAFLVIASLVILIGLGLLQGEFAIVAIPLLYLLIFVPFDETFVTHWYTYINDYYDTRAIKRIVPVLGTAGRVGGIFAGLTISMLNSVLSASGILIVWIVTLMIVAVLAGIMPRILRQDREAHENIIVTPSSHAEVSFRDNLQEGFLYVKQSHFLRWIAFFIFILLILQAFFQYQIWQTLQEQLSTETEISNFLGDVMWITNLLILPIQLFVLSRVIARIGVGNANLIYPIGMLGIASTLLVWPSKIAAGLAQSGRTNFYGAVGYPIGSLLYNAVPVRLKGRSRAFIEGLVVPSGTLIGGLLLWMLNFTPSTTASFFIGVLAVTFVTAAFVIRRLYSQAMIELLEQEDYSFLLTQSASDLSVVDTETLRGLQKKLEESPSHEFTLFMAQLISKIGGNTAGQILADTAKKANDPRTKSGIIDVMIAADLRGEATQQLFEEFLADSNGDVRQSAILGLEEMLGARHNVFRERTLAMLDDADLTVKAQALTSLVHSGDFANLPRAVQELDALLESHVDQERVYGIRILGELGNERAIHDLLGYLTDPADGVRLASMMELEKYCRGKVPNDLVAALNKAAVALLNDPVERTRQLSTMMIGYLNLPDSYEVLALSLNDRSPLVRETAVNTLIKIGKTTIPTLRPLLESDNYQLRKMAIITLSQIDPREFSGLVNSSVVNNLQLIYQKYAIISSLEPLVSHPGLNVLCSALKEENQALIAEIFYLLSAIHGVSSVRIVNESLRSDNQRIRANAAEALESLTSSQTADLIVPLFDGTLTTADLLSIGQTQWTIERLDFETAVNGLNTPTENAWLRVMTLFALGELGVAQKESEAAQTKSKRRPRRPRSGAALDLLGSLTEDAPEAAEVEPPKVVEPVEEVVADIPIALSAIETILHTAVDDSAVEIRTTAQLSLRRLAGHQRGSSMRQEDIMLSTIEKIIFLKEVPFFQGMTIEQLKVLATVCEEQFFPTGAKIYNEGDPGGVLYVVVSGTVGIEQEKRAGSFARLATIDAHSYFGETNLFDNSPYTSSAITVQDTLTLRLRREPLIALARQHPDLSLELIMVLSERLQEANDRVAELTRTRTRKLQNFYDNFE